MMGVMMHTNPFQMFVLDTVHRTMEAKNFPATCWVKTNSYAGYFLLHYSCERGDKDEPADIVSSGERGKHGMA